jgi:hypothetical protein
MRPGLLQVAIILVLGTVLVGTALSQELTSADFDSSGRIDLDDLALLRQAIGGTDPGFDLDGSGHVDLGDLFHFADVVAIPLPSEPPRHPPSFTVRTSRRTLFLSMPEYTARISHGMPFGISSLKHRGQLTDFAHDDLPLADWEWLRYRSSGTGRRQHKLMEMDWGTPEVHSFPERLEAVYQLPISRAGIVAEVRYVFLARGASFHVTYTVINGSSRDLRDVYFMLGLPGFTNHGHITEVTSARERRLPRWPHHAFLEEAAAQELPEYQLLRHYVRPGISEGLKGSVLLRDGDDEFRLSSYYLAESSITAAKSAHTNKPRYLTSHLYATIGDLHPGQRRSVTVHHVLSGP